MQVILTHDVETLGDQGDVVNVSDGYARNFLFPKKFAVPATEGAMADLQRRIDRIKAKAEKKYQEDLKRAESLKALGTISVEALAGDEGKLFGTITTKELSKVLTEKAGFEIERKLISINSPMNRVGTYSVTVKLSAKVITTVDIAVEGKKPA